MFTGPVGPVEIFFYWPEAVFGNFYWPGAIGSPLALSPVLYNWYFCRHIIFAIFALSMKAPKYHPSNEYPALYLFSLSA